MRKLITILIIITAACFTIISESKAQGIQYAEEILESYCNDGAKIRVHYYESSIRRFAKEKKLPIVCLKSACDTYHKITEELGFNKKGFTFSNPDKNYAYDPDRTIDIFIGSQKARDGFDFHDYYIDDFKDAPCFNIVKKSDNQYHTVILISAQQLAGPSLDGLLIHELFHVISYSYNKNLESETYSAHKSIDKYKNDWYVEGLARYLETKADFYEDFMSEGFSCEIEDRIIAYQGGINYFMNNPDQSIEEYQYDFAIFWLYIDQAYGIEKIEEICRLLRTYNSSENISYIFEKSLSIPFEKLILDFSLAVYNRSFDLNGYDHYLKEVSTRKIFMNTTQKYLKDDISPWATDYFKIKTRRGKKLTVESMSNPDLIIRKWKENPEETIVLITNINPTKKIDYTLSIHQR